jgi:hypothetical protein
VKPCEQASLGLLWAKPVLDTDPLALVPCVYVFQGCDRFGSFGGEITFWNKGWRTRFDD